MNISTLFEKRPIQWGLRGDPHLWDALEAWLSTQEIPASSRDFENLLKQGFEQITGKPLSTQGSVFIEAYDTGGMSSGHVSFAFWQDKAIPLLVERHSNASQ